MNSMLKFWGHELKYWSIVKTVTHKLQNYVPATIKIEKTFQKKTLPIYIKLHNFYNLAMPVGYLLRQLLLYMDNSIQMTGQGKQGRNSKNLQASNAHESRPIPNRDF